MLTVIMLSVEAPCTICWLHNPAVIAALKNVSSQRLSMPFQNKSWPVQNSIVRKKDETIVTPPSHGHAYL